MVSRWYFLTLSEEKATHVLEIAGLDWNIRENGDKHHTSQFELVQSRQACILRRGEAFTLGLMTKNRGYDPNRDHVRFSFEFGNYPSVPKGTKAMFELAHSHRHAKESDWRANYVRKSGQRLDVSIACPMNIPVGLWRVRIETWYGERVREKQIYANEDQIYILFNPFHPDDVVSLAHPGGQEEYVQNEVGKLYGGSHNRVHGRPWIFGQFRDSVLPAVCHILDSKANVRDTERGNPILVSRAISALVNSVDEDGLLVGRWDGNYEDGTKPFEWTGTVAILEEYMKSQKSVRYGQCWVFAGVVTTICRALGIPCRPVTNYLSAHDTNQSLSIDKFYDEDGEETTESAAIGSRGRLDSIWNFHVWNETWMKRPDLSSGFDGWQVIDSTPQEQSNYLYQCGPAPVEAVRQGEVGLGYDVTFVFSEVNSDVFVYVPDPKSVWGFKISETNTSHVGQLVLTKTIGYMSDDKEDDYETITNSYKHREGSISERLAVMEAARSVGGNALSYRYPGQKNQDVFLQMIDLDQGTYGEPYKASLFLHNQANGARTIKVVMSTNSVFYTGSKAHLVKKGVGNFVLKPFERETLSMEVSPEDYMPKTVEYCMFMNRFLVTVEETGQTWTGEDDFLLEKPTLQIRVKPNSPRVNRTCTIVIKLNNPLKDELTKCEFSVEAPGLVETLKKRFRL
eukprot:maker-scaffold714_size108203-snap-gene-0.20 protein:Tk02392 transcript:maker-scaffold714_size108203-snap-gene-0.20-mRNA-1 annotation:"hemocyte protein-glutamine gamma-glutamyltransferase"